MTRDLKLQKIKKRNINIYLRWGATRFDADSHSEQRARGGADSLGGSNGSPGVMHANI